MANFDKNKRRKSMDDICPDKSVMISQLNDMKLGIQKMENSFKSPMDLIKRYTLQHRQKINSRVEDLFNQINELSNSLFKKIDDFEKIVCDSDTKNETESEDIQNFITETNEFYQEWSSFLCNPDEISKEEATNLYNLLEIYKIKFPVYANKLESLIFNGNTLDLNENSKKMDTNFLGDLNRSFNKNITINDYNLISNCKIKKIYNLEIFDDDKILMSYESMIDDPIQLTTKIYVLEICDPNLDVISYKSYPAMKSNLSYQVCIIASDYILFYYYCHGDYFVKFDKEFNLIYKKKINYKILNLTWNKNYERREIYILTNESVFNIRVLDENLKTIQSYGQKDSICAPFYFTNELIKLEYGDGKFYCLYPGKLVIIDDVTGHRLKIIDTQSVLIKMDKNNNFYLLDRARSMIVIYDFNGDLLEEVKLINLPEKFDFSISNSNYSRFIVNGNKLCNFRFKIIQ